MTSLTKMKLWIEENAPMLAKLYQNKYVSMAYDRFASYPVRQQKRILQGLAMGMGGFVLLLLLSAYITLWTFQSKTRDFQNMVSNLVDYQQNLRDKSSQLQNLERNSQLNQSGAFKQYLQDQGRNASISPRMIQVEEKQEYSPVEDKKTEKTKASKKEATVKLQKINLEQLRNFLQNIEYGNYKLEVASFKISNDDKIRGYMNVDMTVVAQLFDTEGLGS